MKIQTTLSRRAKISRAILAAAALIIVVLVLFIVAKIVNAGGACQATYIDHTSKGGVTKAACAK